MLSSFLLLVYEEYKPKKNQQNTPRKAKIFTFYLVIVSLYNQK